MRGAFGLQVSCAVRPVLRPGVAEEAEDTAWRGAGRPSLGCCPPTIPERDGRVYGSVEDGVLVLAVTNQPGTLDVTLVRSERFSRVIYVTPPGGLGRRAILKMEAERA